MFCASVLPSLAGWAALLLDRGAGLMALGLLFLVVLPGDLWLARAGLAPGWWMRLRVPLSVGHGRTGDRGGRGGGAGVINARYSSVTSMIRSSWSKYILP